MSHKQQKKGSGFWSGAIVGLILGLAFGGGLYFRQAAIVGELEAKIESQSEQIRQLETSKKAPDEKEEPPLNIEGRSKEILDAMKGRDFAKLAASVHPLKGVRLTPYSRVDPENDLLLTREQIAGAAADKNLYTWGHYDGSGEPIKLTIAEYFNKFVYDHDYLEEADEVGYNRRVIEDIYGMDNSSEIYPGASQVEYYFAGSEEFSGMDWSSLRLVLEKQDEAWYLVGIIHDQWTI